MPGIYGGDEINAIVIDAGSSSTRAGWAGEDQPRVLVPSSYAWTTITDDEINQIEQEASYQSPQHANHTTSPPSQAKVESNGQDQDGDTSMAEPESTSPQEPALSLIDKETKRRRFVGDNGVNLWKQGLEIATPFDEDGIVSELPAFQSLCSHSLDLLSCDPSEHPLLMTEPAWNTKEARERMTEVAFEGLQVPAFYLANRTVLSSFASGKPTSLLVDIGASTISAIPVVDGFILRKGIQKQSNAGDSVSKALLWSLKNGAAGFKGITPQFLVKSKAACDPGTEPLVKLREDRIQGTTESYKFYHSMRVLNDFKEATCQVLDIPWDEGQARLRPTRMFEFPDGYNNAFGLERFKAAETIFSPQLWSSNPEVLSQGKQYEGLTQMILNAINSTDVDSRPALFGNIVCVGGASFLPGLTDRLSYELGIYAPNQKIKIHSPGNTVERKHSSWLGGSILSSLGSFHQLWISKQEYDEHGPSIVQARCK
ncbi:Actin/actin-like protein [Violaceomyces palustris]|uniref:Actin/actin-like protein n=1 Tax=Violaceomyces palustris TaxID=1673888 RepID=A0ACD0NXB9_9BASI|nr:Actin/actin-like protein [Violaceomyces palustris]